MEYRSKGDVAIKFLVILAASIISVAVLYAAFTSGMPMPEEVMHIK